MRLRHHRRLAMLHDFGVAVFLTAALAAAVGVGFRLQPATPASRLPAGPVPDRVLLPLHEPGLAAPLQAVADYLTVMAPTVLIEPADLNPRLRGHDVDLYSRTGEFPRGCQPLPLAAGDPLPAPRHAFPERPVAPPPGDLLAQVEALTRVALTRTPPPPVPPPAARVYWVDSRGRELAEVPELSLAAVPLAKLTATGPTRLECLPPRNAALPDHAAAGTLPVVRLRQSCGSAELDRLATTHLQRFLTRLAAGADAERRRRWFAEPAPVTVVWEFVPNLNYRPDFAAEAARDEQLRTPWYDRR